MNIPPIAEVRAAAERQLSRGLVEYESPLVSAIPGFSEDFQNETEIVRLAEFAIAVLDAPGISDERIIAIAFVADHSDNPALVQSIRELLAEIFRLRAQLAAKGNP